MGNQTSARVRVAVAAIAFVTAAALAVTSAGASSAVKKKPKATAAQIKELATALDLPKKVVKRGLSGLERSDATQEQSGPTALAANDALDIVFFTSFAGGDDEQLFVLKLAAAPVPNGIAYEYALGLAIDGQPLSTPMDAAIDGLGRVPLSRLLVFESGGAVLGLDPAAGYQPIASTATAQVVDVFVVFRVPNSELGEGTYHLQAFGREGATVESPAGFTIVDGSLGA